MARGGGRGRSGRSGKSSSSKSSSKRSGGFKSSSHKSSSSSRSSHSSARRRHGHRPYRGGHRVAVPPTTELTVVFPLKSGKFDTSNYFQVQTDDKATPDEVNLVLKEINEARLPAQRKYDITLCFFILFIIALFAGFIIAIILIIPKNPIFVPVIFICEALLVIVGLFFFIMTLNSLRKKQQTLVQEVVERHNQAFATRGLKWKVPFHFPRWMELSNEYKLQQMQMQQMQFGFQQGFVNLEGPNMVQVIQQQNMNVMNFQGYQMHPQQNMGYEIQNLMKTEGNNSTFGQQPTYQQNYYGVNV